MPKKNNISDSKIVNSQRKSVHPTRIMIEKVSPEIDSGAFPIKRTIGENVVVEANIFVEGHDEIAAVLLYRTAKERDWQEADMKPLGNDRWAGSFPIKKEQDYFYSIRAFVDKFNTWRLSLEKKIADAQDVSVDLKIGIQIIEEMKERIKSEEEIKMLNVCINELKKNKNINIVLPLLANEDLLEVTGKNFNVHNSVVYDKELKVTVERKLALFSSWYEFFPRSWGTKPGKHGSLKDCEELFPEIARMGFDVIYLPPIYPVGEKNRKGANNSVDCKKSEPGCPWAIGSKDGGHKAIHPELGNLASFKSFIKKAKEFNLEIALDLAYQCSPDHPYVKEHPEWFKWRPDGKIQYAENPPKKYEDVLPINFETDDAENLWEELKSVVLFWIEQGVYIFRVDNPHTKPFLFWDWLISEIKKDHPDTIFLSESDIILKGNDISVLSEDDCFKLSVDIAITSVFNDINSL